MSGAGESAEFYDQERLDALDREAATTPLAVPSTARRACGRRAIVDTLDFMLSRKRNVQHLYSAMQREFDESPTQFVRDFATQFMTRELLNETNQQNQAEPVDVAARIRMAVIGMELTTAPGESSGALSTETDESSSEARAALPAAPPPMPDSGIDIVRYIEEAQGGPIE